MRRSLAACVDFGQNTFVPARLQISRIHTATLALILVAAGLIQWLAGRPPICTCGRVKLWTGVVNGPENSQMVMDWYSLSHAVHGLLFYGALRLVARQWSFGRRLVAATLVEAGWELLENSPLVIERYRSATIALGYSGDSILNSMSDVVFMMIGFVVAGAVPGSVSLALGLSLELVSLAAIRDNLTLNVLMLIHPIDAVRLWQSG